MPMNPKTPRKAGGPRAGRKAAVETAVVVTEGAEATEGGEKSTSLRIKDLVERIGGKSTLKKKELREAVEATLAELGIALAAGEDLNLPGLGHMRVTRKAENGAVTLRMRLADPDAPKKKGKKAQEGGAEALADAGEAE